MTARKAVRWSNCVLTRLTSYAQSQGITLNELVKDLLKKDIELIETAK
jgi:predicted HicB family RNase H-like nuclease